MERTPSDNAHLASLVAGTTGPTRDVPSARDVHDVPWLSPDDWIELARLMLVSRAIDEIEENELVPAGKVVYACATRGHELAQILLGFALDHPRDGVSLYYRSRAFALSCGLSTHEAFSAALAKAGSFNGGRDAGAIFVLLPNRDYGGPRRARATVIPAVGDVGAQFSPAAGWAHAVVYRQRLLKQRDWAGAIGVAIGGDGSVATNGFWAALNIVTTYSLPYLFFIEDNGYSISVPSGLQTPGGNIASNLAAFGNLTVLDGDGTDPVEAATKIRQAVTHVRTGSPCLLRLSVPRLNGHSHYDTQAYKSADQKQKDWARDPLPKLRSFLAERRILSLEQWDELAAGAQREAAQARDAAMAEPEPPTAEADWYVFHDPDRPQIVGGLSSDELLPRFESIMPQGPMSSRGMGGFSIPPPSMSGPLSMRGSESMSSITLNAAIRRTLETELRSNPRVVLFGEDVGPMGGLYGTTTSLQTRFGAERVFDTSLSEEGIIGRAVGMALSGLFPVSEIQARKYVEPAMDQLTNCASMRWRTAGKFAAPMVVRMPCGCGPKAGDPFHAVTGEGILAHTSGLRVAFPCNAEDAVGLLRSALRGNDPTVFLEHRALLYAPIAKRLYPGDQYMVPFGLARIVQPGDELTVVTWGETVYRCVSAAEELPNSIEIIDLRTIVPWDKEAVLKSVHKTRRCLIAHEETMICGFGAEIAATLAQEAFFDLDAPVLRVASNDHPTPYNTTLIRATAPTTEKIRAQMRRLLSSNF